MTETSKTERMHKGDEEQPKGKGSEQDQKTKTRRDQAVKGPRTRGETWKEETPAKEENHQESH